MNLSLPDGWTHESAGLSFTDGTRVGAWHNEAADLAVTALVDNGKMPVSTYLAGLFTESDSLPSIGASTACNGTLDAASLTFDIQYSSAQTRSYLMRAVRSGGIVYMFSYSVPKGDPFDPAVLSALRSYCPPEHLRGVG